MNALVGTAPWLALIMVAAAWDVLGIDTGTHEAHLTIERAGPGVPTPQRSAVVGVDVGGYRLRRGGACTLAKGGDATGPVARRRRAAALGIAFVPTAARPALLLPSSRPVGVAFWLAVLVAGVVIDLVARRSKGRFATAEELVRFVSTSRVANVVLVVAWTFAGYHLFAR